MKLKNITLLIPVFIFLFATISCDDILDVKSSLEMYDEDNNLNNPSDTVYSVMGIINKLQGIADRTVLLGEIRGDLVVTQTESTTSLKELSEFNISKDNEYNVPADYYAIINNCNYFLSKVDTTLSRNGVKVFMKEYAAVKVYRAWAYLQTVLAYGEIPFMTDPVLSETDAEKNYPYMGIVDICNYFIDDIRPVLDIETPGYGTISGLNSKNFFIPTRLVLGDLCLWAGRYLEAASYYHQYLTLNNKEIPIGTSQATWLSTSTSFEALIDGFSSQFSSLNSSELICFIPMESNKTNGIVSDLKNIFCSTRDNYYYSQVAPSQSLIDLSKAQSNCVVMINTSSRRDTIYAPDFNNVSDYLVGDLRFFTVYSNYKISQSSNKYSDMYQNIRKFSTDHVWLYRKTQVYLRYAEAMNRAGFPETAFTVLKYGLYNATIQRYISRRERDEAGTLLDFEQRIFTVDNTQGIHSRGSGVASANLNYNFPEQATLADSILFVENLIADECALECGFEGMRYFDLMRFSMHRDDNTYIAEKVANRNGKDETDYAIFTLLTDRKNWFLPLK